VKIRLLAAGLLAYLVLGPVAVAAAVGWAFSDAPPEEQAHRAAVTGLLLTAAALIIPAVLWCLTRLLGSPAWDEVRAEARQMLAGLLRGGNGLAQRLRWAGLLGTVVLAVALGQATSAPVVVEGAAWREYFRDGVRADGSHQTVLSDAFRRAGLDVRAFKLSGAEQVNDAGDDQSTFTFYLAPNDMIKDEIVQRLGEGNAKARRVFETQMVIATYESVRTALLEREKARQPGEEQLVWTDNDGRVRFSTLAYLDSVSAAADSTMTGRGSDSPGILHWDAVLGTPVWGRGPVTITAPSPCYAGGGWSLIRMLVQAQNGAQSGGGRATPPRDWLTRDLAWLYGSGPGRMVPLRSEDVREQWIEGTGGPLSLMYEQDALDVLANPRDYSGRTPDSQRRKPAADPGVLMYPTPAVESAHWLVVRSGTSVSPVQRQAGAKLLDLLTGDSDRARGLRGYLAERFAVRYPDQQLRGSFDTFVTKRLGPRSEAVYGGQPVAGPSLQTGKETEAMLDEVRVAVTQLGCFSLA
jgi:hypothetical protein